MASVRRGRESGRRDKGGALKLDDGKARYDLIPVEPLERLAFLYAKGAQKYGDRNWEKGLSRRRVFAAIGRHTFKYLRAVVQGNEAGKYDEETGEHHLICAAWGCFAIVELEHTGKGEW